MLGTTWWHDFTGISIIKRVIDLEIFSSINYKSVNYNKIVVGVLRNKSVQSVCDINSNEVLVEYLNYKRWKTILWGRNNDKGTCNSVIAFV